MDKNKKTPKQENVTTQIKPIICPICGNYELSFVTDYHKSIWLKLVNNIILILLFITIIINFSKIISGEIDLTIIILLVSIYTLLNIVIYLTESKTHVKAICRQCGHIWLID